MTEVIEYQLHGIPCVVCGRPGIAFVPFVGIRHAHDVCRLLPRKGAASTRTPVPIASSKERKRGVHAS